VTKALEEPFSKATISALATAKAADAAAVEDLDHVDEEILGSDRFGQIARAGCGGSGGGDNG